MTRLLPSVIARQALPIKVDASMEQQVQVVELFGSDMQRATRSLKSIRMNVMLDSGMKHRVFFPAEASIPYQRDLHVMLPKG